MSIKVKINNDWVDTNIKAVRGVNRVNSEDAYTKEEIERKFATKTEVQTQINNSITKENIENTIEAWLEEDNESTNGEVYTKQESDALFSGKVSKSDIVQSTGTSTTAVMSQKAVMEISDKVDELDDKKKDNNLFLGVYDPILTKIIKSIKVYSNKYKSLYVIELVHSDSGRILYIDAIEDDEKRHHFLYYVKDTSLVSSNETITLTEDGSADVIDVFVTWNNIFANITNISVEVNMNEVVQDYNKELSDTNEKIINVESISNECRDDINGKRSETEITDFTDKGKFLYDQSTLESPSYNITDYIPITNVTSIELTNVYSGTNNVYGYVLYDKEKNIIGYNPTPDTSGDHDYTILNDGKYTYLRCTQQAGHNSSIHLVTTELGLKAEVETLKKENTIANKNWLLIGDSITEHNFRAKKNYHDYIKEELGCNTINFGVSGAGYRINNIDSLNFTKILDAKMAIYPETSPDFVTIMGGINDMMFDTSLIGEITDKTNETLLGSVYLLLQRINHYFPNVRVGIMTPIAEIQMPNIDSSMSVRYRFNIGDANPVSKLSVGDAYFGNDHNKGLYRYEVTEVHLDNGVGYFYAESHIQDTGYPACRALPLNGGTMSKLDGTGVDNITYESATSNVLNIFVKKLKEFCEYYNVMFLDQYHCTGLRPWDSAYNEQYFKYSESDEPDGLHPNAEGHKLIYPRIREFLKTMI